MRHGALQKFFHHLFLLLSLCLFHHRLCGDNVFPRLDDVSFEAIHGLLRRLAPALGGDEGLADAGELFVARLAAHGVGARGDGVWRRRRGVHLARGEARAAGDGARAEEGADLRLVDDGEEHPQEEDAVDTPEGVVPLRVFQVDVAVYEVEKEVEEGGEEGEGGGEEEGQRVERVCEVWRRVDEDGGYGEEESGGDALEGEDGVGAGIGGLEEDGRDADGDGDEERDEALGGGKTKLGYFLLEEGLLRRGRHDHVGGRHCARGRGRGGRLRAVLARDRWGGGGGSRRRREGRAVALRKS